MVKWGGWAIACVVSMGPMGRSVAQPPPLSSASAILMDVNTRDILYAKHIHQRWPPGSLVKIMTAWLAIRYGWHKTGQVTPYAAHLSGTSLDLPVGTKVPLHQLVPAMMMASGNDAAEVVAETIAHNDRAFVRCMNHTAKSWHLGQIHFANPTGLPDNNQWATAMALARLTQHVMRNRVFASIVRQAGVTVPGTAIPRFYLNQNQLIGKFPGTTGVKLGYTGPHNAALVITATRHHTELVVVLLHDTPSAVWPDATRLLTWGFLHTSAKDTNGGPGSQGHFGHGTIRSRGVFLWRKFGSGTVRARP